MYSYDPRSLEELVKDHYAGVDDNDRNIGAVLQVIKEQNLLDKTAVLLSSDHGFFTGERHSYDKRLMYEPSIRAPMMIRYPARVKPSTEVADMVLKLDMAPTMLDLAGLPVPADMQGKSMMPLAEGQKDVPWRKDWLYEYYEYPALRTYGRAAGVRTGRYKYIHFYLEPEELELYDLQTDPDERNNLYGKPVYEQLTAHLRDRLAALRKETNHTFRYKPTGLPLHPGLSATDAVGAQPSKK